MIYLYIYIFIWTFEKSALNDHVMGLNYDLMGYI